MNRIHLRLYGAVQGVGFRAYARHVARSAGVRAGWVRNRPDGAVELEAEAEALELDRFRQLVTRGPSHAYVDRVEELAVSTDPLPTPFAILH